MENFQAVIATLKEHGAEYSGIQKGIGDIADMILFRDLTTGTSLALPMANVSRKAITEKLSSARARFGY